MVQPARAANEEWCADFKGWFETGDGSRCDPLTITDSHCRYLLATQVSKPTLEAVREVFEASFRA